jgi:hypothetical protein
METLFIQRANQTINHSSLSVCVLLHSQGTFEAGIPRMSPEETGIIAFPELDVTQMRGVDGFQHPRPSERRSRV